MTSAPKHPGRPRDEKIDVEIVRALFELVEEVGLGAVTIGAIASRAGVSKATIYRRWDSKEELLVDAIAGLTADTEPPDAGGSVREQLVASIGQVGSFMSQTTAGLVFPWLVGEVAAGSEIGRRYAETVIYPRREAVKALIGRAVDQGELRSDLNVDLAADMLAGPLILNKLVASHQQTTTKWIEELVDTLLEGWVPPS
jgi:AcrR family transcriptional regulator